MAAKQKPVVSRTVPALLSAGILQAPPLPSVGQRQLAAVSPHPLASSHACPLFPRSAPRLPAMQHPQSAPSHLRSAYQTSHNPIWNTSHPDHPLEMGTKPAKAVWFVAALGTQPPLKRSVQSRKQGVPEGGWRGDWNIPIEAPCPVPSFPSPSWHLPREGALGFPARSSRGSPVP